MPFPSRRLLRLGFLYWKGMVCSNVLYPVHVPTALYKLEIKNEINIYYTSDLLNLLEIFPKLSFKMSGNMVAGDLQFLCVLTPVWLLNKKSEACEHSNGMCAEIISYPAGYVLTKQRNLLLGYQEVYLSQAISTRKWRGIIPMGAQTRTDVLPYISLIPVFGYLWPGTSKNLHLVIRIHSCQSGLCRCPPNHCVV